MCGSPCLPPILGTGLSSENHTSFSLTGILRHHLDDPGIARADCRIHVGNGRAADFRRGERAWRASCTSAYHGRQLANIVACSAIERLTSGDTARLRRKDFGCAKSACRRDVCVTLADSKASAPRFARAPGGGLLRATRSAALAKKLLSGARRGRSDARVRVDFGKRDAPAG